MSYINNEIITVDAVLTKKGRELLASQGGLNITAFALADDEIDYRLYQPNHPQGSAYYDLAVRKINGVINDVMAASERREKF